VNPVVYPLVKVRKEIKLRLFQDKIQKPGRSRSLTIEENHEADEKKEVGYVACNNSKEDSDSNASPNDFPLLFFFG
jgi:hypothetical protein